MYISVLCEATVKDFLYPQVIHISLSKGENITDGNVGDNCSSFSTFFFPF